MKPFGSPPLDQVRRSGVQPVLVEAEVSCNDCSCGQERAGEWLSKTELPLVCDGEEIHVPGGTPDKAERCERGAADHDYLHMAAEGVQLLAQRAE